jgi:VanZ family protein
MAGMARIARWIALAIAVAIAAVTLSPISSRPKTAAPADVERALAFALLGGTIALGYFRHRDLLVGILLAILFAALLEAGQNFVPGRHGHMHDLLIKALAVILGAAVVWILRRMQRGPQLPPQ